MRKISSLFFILFVSGIAISQTQESEAANEVFSKIVKAEIASKENKQLNQGDLNEIVCLTNIETKKFDGNYLGIFYLPSESEIKLWKDWFEKNKTLISYCKNCDDFNREYFGGKQKVIQIEYESGKFRNSVCDEDKMFMEWWPKWKAKN